MACVLQRFKEGIWNDSKGQITAVRREDLDGVNPLVGLEYKRTQQSLCTHMMAESDEARVILLHLLVSHQLLQPSRTASVRFCHPNFSGMAVTGVAVPVVILP